jgi:hypothetical protein
MNLRSFLAGITAAVMMMLALVAVAPAMADDQSCGAVIGMSVVRNTYHGSTLDTSGNVELIWHPGTTLGQWADPGATMWSNLRTENDCGDPTWATFGFDPSPVRRINGFSGSNQAQFDQLVDAAVANIRNRWPSIERLDLWLIVGTEHGTTCTVGGKVVRGAQLHNDVYDGLVDYLSRHPEVGAGPDIHIACDGFSDWIGHLNDAGKAEAGAFLDAWYLDVPEPTTTTTIVETTTTTVEEPTTTLEETTTTSVVEESTTTTSVVEESTTTTTLPACLPEEV